MTLRRFALAPLALLLVAGASLGCAAQGPVERAPARPAGSSAAPVVVVDKAQLASSREEACRRVAAKEVKDAAQGAAAAGMLKGDYEGFQATTARLHVTITFRDSNPACLPHLAAGVQSKGHDLLQKTWDPSNLLPEDQQLAGLVSNLFEKPPKGEKIKNPQLALHDGQPVTCDHDMMDMLEADGQRIAGESPRDLEIRVALNTSTAPTPKGHRDRVMHGAQAGYQAYIVRHPEEPVITSLYRPEAPLTAFDHDGRVYHLDTVADDLAFYQCKGAGLPPEWDVEAEDRSAAPPHRERVR